MFRLLGHCLCFGMKRPSGTEVRDAKRRALERTGSDPVRVACLGDSNTVGGGLGRLVRRKGSLPQVKS